MTQDDQWFLKYNEVKELIERERRNPSKHRIEEHDLVNWMKANRKLVVMGKKYDMPILYSCHPRSRKRLEDSGYSRAGLCG